MSCQRESARREFTPVLVPGREFHSGTKSRNANQRSGSDEKLSAHSDFSPDTELLTPTESRWGRRSFKDPICCNFCMVLSMFSSLVLAGGFGQLFICSAIHQLDTWTLAPQKTHGTLDPRHSLRSMAVLSSRAQERRSHEKFARETRENKRRSREKNMGICIFFFKRKESELPFRNMFPSG